MYDRPKTRWEFVFKSLVFSVTSQKLKFSDKLKITLFKSNTPERTFLSFVYIYKKLKGVSINLKITHLTVQLSCYLKAFVSKTSSL